MLDTLYATSKLHTWQVADGSPWRVGAFWTSRSCVPRDSVAEPCCTLFWQICEGQAIAAVTEGRRSTLRRYASIVGVLASVVPPSIRWFEGNVGWLDLGAFESTQNPTNMRPSLSFSHSGRTSRLNVQAWRIEDAIPVLRGGQKGVAAVKKALQRFRDPHRVRGVDIVTFRHRDDVGLRSSGLLELL